MFSEGEDILDLCYCFWRCFSRLFLFVHYVWQLSFSLPLKNYLSGFPKSWHEAVFEGGFQFASLKAWKYNLFRTLLKLNCLRPNFQEVSSKVYSLLKNFLSSQPKPPPSPTHFVQLQGNTHNPHNTLWQVREWKVYFGLPLLWGLTLWQGWGDSKSIWNGSSLNVSSAIGFAFNSLLLTCLTFNS